MHRYVRCIKRFEATSRTCICCEKRTTQKGFDFKITFFCLVDNLSDANLYAINHVIKQRIQLNACQKISLTNLSKSSRFDVIVVGNGTGGGKVTTIHLIQARMSLRCRAFYRKQICCAHYWEKLLLPKNRIQAQWRERDLPLLDLVRQLWARINPWWCALQILLEVEQLSIFQLIFE